MIRRSFSSMIAAFLFLIPNIYAFSMDENFLLIDGMTGTVISELGIIHKQMSPCSTFKIPLSLMGFDAEVLKDETNPTWNFQEGYDDWLASWRAPQSPQSWIKYSCIWYSKILSFELGLERIKNYLKFFQYGNQNTSGGLAEPGPLDSFWVNSSLEISPKEQVGFIRKMILGELSISLEALYITRALLFREELPESWKLFWKTGWSGSDIGKDGSTLEHSWVVGWIETQHNFYPFAYLIFDKKINLDQRIPRVKQLLTQSLTQQLIQ